MIFIFGSRLYGKVDVVPGLFHVATKFAHVDYIPLIPTGSWLVLEETSGGWRGVPIGLSFKSLMVAWGRMAGWVGTCTGLVILMVAMGERHMDIVLPLLLTALGAGLLVFLYLYKGLTHASYDRAYALAVRAGFNENGLNQLRKIFDMPEEYSAIHGFEVKVGQPRIAQEAPAEPAAPRQRVFFVTGHNREKGTDVCVTVHARDAAEARQTATASGIHVENVEAGEK